MKREHQIVIKFILLLCIASLVCTGCGKSEAPEAESDELTVTPTEIPKFEPKSAAELAQKTAEKLENLESVHMQLSANVNAKLDLLGTIMSGFGGIGSGESFVPDLDSIIGKGDRQGQTAGVSTAAGNYGLRAAVCEPADKAGITAGNYDLRTAVCEPAGKADITAGNYVLRAAICKTPYSDGSAGDYGMPGRYESVQKVSASSDSKSSVFSMALLYDADIEDNPAGMHFYGNAAVNILGTASDVPVDAYYFEEGSEHALYTRSEDRWQRQVVEMESVRPSLSSKFFESIADGTVNAGLSDVNVEVNGHDTYRLNVTVSGENIASLLPEIMGPLQSAVENDETLAPLFGSMSESVDLSGVSLPIKIYIDRETLYPVQMRMEMTEFGKQLLDALSVVKVNVDAFDAVIDYSGINETSAGEAPQVG
ncbi:MAG: hypothetical protein IKG19_01025 [Lachnospiraceae bacterium]|nr:hypothetical protein [Lachnospiraceae bacterium]